MTSPRSVVDAPTPFTRLIRFEPWSTRRRILLGVRPFHLLMPISTLFELTGLFKDKEATFRHSAFPPSSGHKAVARIGAPNCFRIDVCVMPLTRPDVISDRIRLTNKFGRPDRSLVTKDGAVDASLPTSVDELSPNKHGVSISGPEHDLFTWADEQISFPAILVLVAGVVPFVECETGDISILC